MEENVVREKVYTLKSNIHKLLFQLLLYGLNECPRSNDIFSKCSCIDWKQVFALAQRQRLSGICMDAVNPLPKDKRPPSGVLMQCIANVVVLEKIYNQQKNTITNLSALFSEHGLRMVLMKGYGLSRLYPVPEHRGCGDLDVYFCGMGQYADEIIKKQGIEVKQNEEKHSVYDYRLSQDSKFSVHVENHSSIICEQEHPSLSKVEEFLKKELDDNVSLDAETGCWLPSAMFNVVFLPLHFAGHFVYGGANLRQIVDYALVVKTVCQKSETDIIDWEKVKALAVEGGYFNFLCCLNGICIDSIGIPASCVPDWPRDKAMEERILDDVLNPGQTVAQSLPDKIKRYICNRWKYRLVYSKESHLQGFLLRTRSWLNWKWGKKSVWKI